MGPRGYVHLQAAVVLVCDLLLLLIYSLTISYMGIMHSDHNHPHPHIHMGTHTFYSLSHSPFNRSLPVLCPLVLFLFMWPTGFNQAIWVDMGIDPFVYIWPRVCCFRYSPSQHLDSSESRETWLAGRSTLVTSVASGQLPDYGYVSLSPPLPVNISTKKRDYFLRKGKISHEVKARTGI